MSDLSRLRSEAYALRIPVRKADFRPLTREEVQSEALWWKGKSIVLRGHIDAIRARNTESKP